MALFLLHQRNPHPCKMTESYALLVYSGILVICRILPSEAKAPRANRRDICLSTIAAAKNRFRPCKSQRLHSEEICQGCLCRSQVLGATGLRHWFHSAPPPTVKSPGQESVKHVLLSSHHRLMDAGSIKRSVKCDRSRVTLSVLRLFANALFAASWRVPRVTASTSPANTLCSGAARSLCRQQGTVKVYWESASGRFCCSNIISVSGEQGIER